MFKSLDKKDIYDNSSISFCFEFFSPMRKMDAAAKIARALGKKVKWFSSIDPKFEATNETFLLAPTYSNGYKEMRLSTGMIPYQEGLHMFLKISNIIEAIGFTTDRCRVKTKIKINESALGLQVKMDKLNRVKYLLGLNEKKLFELWPQPENDRRLVYQNQVNYIRPKRLYETILTPNVVKRANLMDLSIPESDFFGNDFSEIGRGKLVINYIGGKDYTKKKKEAVEAINLVIDHLYETLKNNYDYTNQEDIRISSIVSEFKNAIDSTRNPLTFKSSYPDIDLYVDLKADKYSVEAGYPQIREKVFQIVVGGGISEGSINYDTRRGKIQIKGAKLKRSIVLEGVEFFDCEIEGDVKGCLFDRCIIRNSKLTECTINYGNLIKFSKVMDCDYLGESNEIVSSFLDNSSSKLISGDLRECVINRGKLSLSCKMDDSTKIIQP
jgi:hypothetical protein